MISKPPLTDDTNLNIWMQEVYFNFNNTVVSRFFPVSPLGTGAAALHGKHSTRNLTAGTQTAYMEAIIPHGIRAFKEAGIRIIPTTSGSINYTVNFSYGAVEADENALTKTASVNGLSVTDDQIAEVDLPISTFFTDLEGGDQLGVEFVLDALTTTTSVHVLGLYIKYI